MTSSSLSTCISSSSTLSFVSRPVSAITESYPVSAANGANCAARSIIDILGCRSDT
ncbi:MAG: hypothetical protein MJY94_07845 [Bacteroidales bacterium]|nr:hypothetical protein [Bacteroidales bacterium]